MSYIPLRIDFVELETHCARLSDNGRIHGFPSGKATFLLHENDGRDYPYGPVCAGRMVGGREPLRGIPDFTTRDFSPLQEDEDEIIDGNGQGRSRRPADDSSDDEKAQAFAKRYLMLRMDRVANIPGIQPGIKYASLANIYAQFQQTRELSGNDVNYIINLEKSPKTPTAYRSNWLLDVYTAYVQLQRQIKGMKPGTYLDFLISVRDKSLLQRLKLSSAQIEKAKLKLHPQAFQE